MTFPVVDLVAIRRVVEATNNLIVSRKPARMIIQGENPGATPIYIPYAPIRVEHDDLGGSYNLINRPGTQDATVFGSPNVHKMSFSLLLIDRVVAPSRIAGRSPAITTVVAIIRALSDYSAKGIRVGITYGALESGFWYIDDVSVSTMKRDPASDEVIQAVVSLSLIRASDVLDGTGPLTGGASKQTPPPPSPPQQTSSRYYPVKRGDTLWAIAIMFYGSGTRWTEIADANGITDPRLLQPDTVLRIP